ncbi:MAG TPA: tripartite tricarboxylate transporter TctB family protein [Candidatus Binatia bacterium]|nr:tripartite tricarboxylate transporter TctB family protein [Candidatus Binatia bacterium]
MTTSFTLFLVAIFLGAIWWGWQWPYIAKLMPVFVAAVPGFVLGVIQLFREATGAEGRAAKKAEGVQMDDTHKTALDQKTEIRRTLIFFAWFIGGAIGIWLLGIVITLPLLVFLYMIIEGREKLVSALVMTVCTYGLIWGLFEYTLEMRWPSGLLFGY